jgi:hypothetical protein
MNSGKILRAIFLPVTELAVLLPLILFAVLTTLGVYGGLLGIFILILLLPPVFRFQMLVLEASAKGVKPDPLDAENFSFAGSGWALFPLPLVIFIVWAAFKAAERFGEGGANLVIFIAAWLLPAILAVLAITRSPLQSINPVAIGRLLKACGGTFWIASVYLFATGWLCLQLVDLPLLFASLLQLILTFSFFSLTGALVEPYGVVDDVYIPDAIEPDDKEIRGDIEKSRVAALGHAYGFISRDNRKGGFAHLFDAIAKDPDTAAAWAWYFSKMLGWEQQQHAVFFGQYYVQDALRHGENLIATKVIMRCRLVDEGFRPFPEDLPAAIAAVEATGNAELAAVLKRP